jgi:cysteine-rich repeat protein
VTKNSIAVRLCACVALAAAAWGCGDGELGAPAEGVGETGQAIQTCFTVQRGVFGTVSDAELRSDLPDTGAGSGVFARVGIASTSTRRALFRFDVSSIPQGVTIDSALVTLQQAGANGNATFGVHPVTSPWSESGATFNNITFQPTPVTTLSNGGNGYIGPVSFDISSLVQGWVDGTSTNEGFVLARAFPLTATAFSFERTSEDPVVSNRPSLSVCYTCTPTAEVCDGLDNDCNLQVDEGGVCNTCGNGILDPGETCEDGNAVSGDGCSAACLQEPGWEIESNNTFPTANDAALVSQGGLIKGTISPAYDGDNYLIQVPFGFTATVDAETQDGPFGTTCASGAIDAYMVLWDAVPQSIELYAPAVGNCKKVYRTGLPAGSYTLSVSDNPITGSGQTFDYTLRLDVTLYPCGDGQRDVGEQCDDGNMANGDGCSDLCTLEGLPEAEPNGTNAQALANGTHPVSVAYAADISPLGDVDVFAFDVTTVSDVKVETFGPYGAYTYCPNAGNWDTSVELYAPDGQTVLALNDNGGVNIVGTGAFCSRIDPATAFLARKLQPGTYYARVTGKSSLFTVDDYRLVIRYVSQCGDGSVDGSEECDGGAGCDPVGCVRLPACGDGLIDGPETCDDGNLVSGDGCSASCAAEAPGVFTEIEPNGTIAQADFRATTGTKLRITRDTKITASMNGTDKDFYRVDLGSDTVLQAETLDASGVDCLSPVATQMKLYDAAGNVLESNVSSGVGACSMILTWLPAGTYYLDVERISTTGFGYVLDVKLGADVGTEAEVNDAAAQANGFAGSDAFVLGHHLANADQDWYAITVPGGSSLRAATLAGSGKLCSVYAQLDTRLTLYDAALTQLADDEDGGAQQTCSRIDGFGSSPVHPGASGLAAGTYYLQVRAGALAQTSSAGQFDYRLYVTVH